MNANVAPDDVKETKDPLFLCPIDLRKLQEAFLCFNTCNKFEIEEHYKSIEEWCKKHKFEGELNWLSKRLSSIAKVQ